jgi:hypothetical protein
MKIIFYLKQNLPTMVVIFFLLTITGLLLLSCRKECGDKHNCECNEDEPDPKIDYREFFIAHAGGAIDGIIYTNCLEALDLSYSMGCRLMELDLVPTIDGKLVGSHAAPPQITEEEFMNTPIEGKYTPMNMESINIWFRDHPDAILITDKTNNPEKIYNEFHFIDRVVMELFTWAAVDKAIELGITPLVSENLIFGSSKKAIEMGIEQIAPIRTADIEELLKNKKIKYIGMSRNRIFGNENLLRRLKEKGIKNYVWTLEWPINGQPPEQFVWNYEMNFCYGMYANNLDLLASLLNPPPSKK